MEFNQELVATIDVSDRLGEGVLWRASDETIWWTDILGQKIHRLTWPAKDLTSYDTPERVGAFSFIEGHDSDLLVAFESGFARFTPATGVIDWLDRPVGLSNGVRMNDGRTDPQGRFWVGSMVERDLEDGERPSGVLYRFDETAPAAAILGGVHISNGLCWSPDNKHIYFADSAIGTVFRAEWDARSGVPGHWKTFATFDGVGPDGAITDASGAYWSALWGGSRVACVDKNGNEVAALSVPVTQPTCVGFGGANLDLMLVTTAKEALSEQQIEEQPHAGSLLIYKTSARGWPQSSAKLSQ